MIYARSSFHHSVNYRSAIIHGRLRTVTDPEEQLVGLRTIVEHVAPGSWAVARPPSAKERAATAVVALDLTEASVKVRAADPGDEPEDIAADLIWAGVLPIEQERHLVRGKIVQGRNEHRHGGCPGVHYHRPR